MARGEDTRNHPKRQIGRPKVTPQFELNDSPQQVARDWSQGNSTALGRFADQGEITEGTFKELNHTLDYGAPHPREKERLTNLRKHLESQKANGDQ